MGKPTAKRTKFDRVESCLDQTSGRLVAGHYFGDDWETSIYPAGQFFANEQVVPVDKVRAVIIENYELRNELYERSNDQLHRQMQFMEEICGTSTSTINNMVTTISSFHNIGKPIIYNIIYETLKSFHVVNLNNRQPGESKLRKIWRLGYIPLTFIITKTIYTIFMTLSRACSKDLKAIVQQLNGKMKL